MSEDMYRGLIRDIEATKGRQSTHEAECALRYSRIEENTGTMKTDIARALAALETLAKRGEHAAWSANWKAWIIAAGIGALLLSWGVWSAAQLYQLEPLRVKAEAKK